MMKPLVRKLLMISSILFAGCSKEDLQEKLQNKLSEESKSKFVTNFNNFNMRKGTWVNITHVNERSTSQDTIEFNTDTTWSLWNKTKFEPPYIGQINQKKYVITNYDGKSGQLRNYANFLDSPTKDFRTYIWYYDSLQGYVYIDFNKDFRFSSQKVVYSRFVKIK